MQKLWTLASMKNRVLAKREEALKPKCYHCGETCEEQVIHHEDKVFCCEGCRLVYTVLAENELCDYYQFEKHPGISQKKALPRDRFYFLDQDEIVQDLLDFCDDNFAKVTLVIPSVHCSSCIWLLENLKNMHPGILESQLNFSRKELTVNFNPTVISLRSLAEFLDRIGYPPHISLSNDPSRKREAKRSYDRKLLLKLGIAGFCFGNIMLLSFPEYLGIGDLDQHFKNFFNYLMILLALPVVFYSGIDYFRSAFKSIQQKYLNIDVPVALGVTALLAWSVYAILHHEGAGYLDSLAGLIFFLLIGKWFQNRTYQKLSFDRDFASFFPLAITKMRGEKREVVPLRSVKALDILLIHNQEVIPADGKLLSEEALIDYSFVTGESRAVPLKKGAKVYAGGRQVGQAIELEVEKAVAESYLTQLWNQESFQKEHTQIQSLVDQVAKYFTYFIVSVAATAALYYFFTVPGGTWIRVFTAVLIVACPCALALALPFTFGTAMNELGKRGFYLKDAALMESLANINTLLFDKTGTLTEEGSGKVAFHGSLLPAQWKMIELLASQSLHPMSRLVAGFIKREHAMKDQSWAIADFHEKAGKGLEGKVNGVRLKLGSKSWVSLHEEGNLMEGNESQVHVTMDGQYMGYFAFTQKCRAGLDKWKAALKDYKTGVLSGDVAISKEELEAFMPDDTFYAFEQKPHEKAEIVTSLKTDVRQVAMLGDGLNDAVALRAAHVGIAVCENNSHFTPASDAILQANALPRLPKFLHFARLSKRIIYGGFGISFAYNLVGLFLAVTGQLSPLWAAVLMPLSSLTVVFYAVLVTRLLAQKTLM